ncbi:hypothetical protein HIM_03586 [Hirsutella minnesotensis 3608]|uniref:NADPH-dependent FMN reductase-like domain-containing protein n=1 Tax=Hirsutella minnesotensis 3608 TaxID=1043627 RepID=A0A0F7ZQH6_9HYPO|nr:hypothetical protein HIM_03586 [Hirsutella minnesotensis 3608]
MASGKKVAVVTCSLRPQRLNPLISDYVHKTVAPLFTGIQLESLDIASFNLPIFDEATIPARLPADDPTPHYSREHTKAWSTAVRGYDGFIFRAVVAQEDILSGLRMKPAAASPGLTTSGDMMANRQLAEADERRWREAGVEEQLASMARELVQGLSSE